MVYWYHTAQGKAALNKGDGHALKQLGKFKTEREAVEACKRHHEKACAALRNLGQPEPVAHFM
jgi:hypothetical protein